MADNDVRVIIQDREGTLWFGTRSGVSRFEGKSWHTYTQNDGLADNDVRAIIQDRDGTLWFGTRSGVSRFEGNSWHTYTQNDGLADNDVRAIIQDRDGTLWFGTRSGVSRFEGNSWHTYTQNDGLTNSNRGPGEGPPLPVKGGPGPKGMRRMRNDVRAIIQDKEGSIWFGTGNGVSRFEGNSWQTYTQQNSLAGNPVNAIIQDQEGAIWFGTGNGVSRFEGNSWQTYTQQNSLAGNPVNAIIQDQEGAIWFGTGNGVSRFEGNSWKIYTQNDGLADNAVLGIIQDRKGAMWFGTRGGVSRFDGKNWTKHAENEVVNAIFQDKKGTIRSRAWDDVSRLDEKNWRAYRKRDELARNWIIAFLEDKEGAMWFGTRGRGVKWFDGKNWKTYTQKDGLAHNAVFAIIQDKEGAIWFGTWNGVSRFDGKNWKTYTQKDGLADKRVNAILQDSEGAFWFGTDGGVSRYDGKSWKTYTQKDGLASNAITSILQDKEGVIWFGTDNGGISRFDGRCFQTTDSRDGLANDSVNCLYMDRSGQIWLGTDSGAVRFIPNKIPPPVHITEMIADETYINPKGTIQLSSAIRSISLNYHAISFKTRLGEMKYFYQLVGKDADWQGPTNQETIEYFNLEPREYIFQVQAVDRDLNYSEIASVLIFIPLPPFYKATIFPVSLSIIVGMSLFGVIILGIQRLRLSRAEKMRLQKELEDAHQMQLSLLPKSAPLVEGFDIAGSSRPAREVGGDFFDYLSLTDGKSGIALADVSGKGLKSAMNAVLASGMLHVLASGMIHELVKIEVSCGEILSVLNAHLYPRMEKQMFTALGLAIFDQNATTLKWANAAQPYPIVKRGEQVFEFESESDLPLGMMRNLEYQDWELELRAGDIVIFYTDGIIEAENETEEMYGTERLEQIITNISSTISAEEIIKTILQDVDDFVGTAEQYDDMTVVVVKKL